MLKDYQYVLQENSYDCGISCLKTIFLQIGKKIKNEDIKINNYEKGTTALELINASKKLGLNAKGIKLDVESYNFNYFPCIAHVIKDKNLFHYIVIFSNDKRKKLLTIMDPSFGIKKITYNTFNNISTKIFIIFDYIKSVKTHDVRFKNYFLSIYQKVKKKSLKTVFLSLFVIIFSLIFNYYLKYLLQYKNNLNLLLKIFIAFIIISIFKNIFEYIRNKIIINISKNIDINVTKEFIKHIIHLPKKIYFNKSTGELITLTSDLENFKNIITKIFILCLVDFILLTIILIFVSFYSIYFSIAFIILILIIIAISIKYQDVFNNDYQNTRDKKIIFSNVLIESLNSFNSIKNLCLEKRIIEKITKSNIEKIQEESKLNKHNNNYLILVKVIIEVLYLLILFLFIILFNANKLPILDIVFISNIYYLFANFLNSIADSLTTYKMYKNSITKILDVLETEEEKKSNSSINVEKISLNNINFSYNKKEIIKNLNFNIFKNERILITGSSGSGKSTIMKIILKELENYTGDIFVNNINQKYLNYCDLKKNITNISQEERLFSGSILDNLNIVSYNLKDIKKALDTCLITDFFVNSNIDENFFLEDNGNNLSGGERKKILIARGLLKNSNILILDEIFNEIDIKSERKILNNIKKNYPNLTIIQISHRLNNKDLFNKCYKLENKQLIEEEM